MRCQKTMAKMQEQKLPEDVLMEIFLRLPARSMLRFSCVSKQWNSIIGNGRFHDLHSLRSPHPGRLSPATLFFRFHEPRDPTAVNQPFIALSYTGSTVQHIIRLQNSPPAAMDLYLLSMTCNGLLCIFPCLEFRQHSILICNPLTLEYVPLPPCSAVKRLPGLPGLGIAPSTKEYKVVCISLIDKIGTTAKGSFWIHTVGNGAAWREVESGVEFGSCMAKATSSSRVYAGGKIYWLFHWSSENAATIHYMLSFDVESEKAATIVNVPGFLEDHFPELHRHVPDYRLVAMGDDRVTLSVNKGIFGGFEVWELIKDEHWDMKHKIDASRLSSEGWLVGIWELGDGDVLALLKDMTTTVLHDEGRDAVTEKNLKDMTSMVLHDDSRDAVIEKNLKVSMSWIHDWSLCCGYKPGLASLSKYQGCQRMEIVSEETQSKCWLNPPPNLLLGCDIHQ